MLLFPVHGNLETVNQHQITVQEDGDYLLGYNHAISSALVRGNTLTKVLIDGTPVPGAYASTSYQRNNSTENEGSNSLQYLLEDMSAGEVITVTIEQEGIVGTANDDTPAMLWLWKKEAAAGTPTTLSNLTIDPSSAGTITLQTNDLNIGGALNVASGDVFSIPSSRTTTNNSYIIIQDFHLKKMSANAFR